MEDIEERDKLIQLYEKYSELLPQSQKQIIYLYLFEDLSFSEIGRELAMTRASAYDGVKKAKKKLLLLDKKISQND